MVLGVISGLAFVDLAFLNPRVGEPSFSAVFTVLMVLSADLVNPDRLLLVSTRPESFTLP